MTSPYRPTNPFAPRSRPYSPNNPFAPKQEEEEENRGLLGRVAGALETTLGPLARTVVEGMAYAGPTGAAPARGESPRQRMEQVERVYREEGRRLSEDYPKTSLGLGLGGAVVRYGAATALGGPYAAATLGVAESLASRPEESLAGLAATGAGMAGMEKTQAAAQRIAENPLGRAATDILGGELIGQAARVVGRTGAAGVRRIRGGRPATPEQRLTEDLAAVRSARTGEPMATELPQRALPAPTEPWLPEMPKALPSPVRVPPPPPKALPAPKFPPESPRFRTRTVAEEREALAEQQLRDAQSLDEAIAARQAAWEAESATRVRALEEEPSRFPGSPSFRPPPPPIPRRSLQEALDERASQLARMGQQRQARELQARIGFLDEMRKPWDELSEQEQRQFETFMTYYESRKAQGLMPDATEVGPKAMLRAQTRALRQLAAMEAWYKLPEAERSQFIEAMQREGRGRQLEAMESGWRKAIVEMAQTPLDQIVLINPQTGREVTVSAALKRSKNHPARFEAEAFLDELNTAMQELSEGVARGRERPSFLSSRIGERPRPELAAEMPPVPLDEAERRAAREAGAPGRRASEREMMRLRNRLGAVDPALLRTLASTLGGTALGGIGGAAAAEKPEDIPGMALAGALLGAGATGGASLLRRAGDVAPERFNEALESIATRAGRASTFSPRNPFAATAGTVEGVSVRGVKRGMPIPDAQMASRAGQPLTPTAEAIVDQDRNLLQRMNLEPSLQDRLAPRIAEIRANMGPRKSWQEESREAARLLNTQRENLAGIAPKNMTGAQGLAIASLVRENTEVIGRNLDALKALEPTDVAGKNALLDQIDDLDKQNVALLTTIMAGRRAQAQALNANKILANLTSDPTYWLLKAERVKGAEMLTQEQRMRITNLLNKGEPGRKELLQYIASLRQTSWLGQVAQMRRAGLLTGLAGRARDVLSTGNSVIVQPLLRAAGGAATDAVLSRYVGGRVGVRPEQFRTMAMPRVQEFRAMREGAKNGLRDAVNMLGLEYVKRGEFKNLVEFVRQAELDPDFLRRMDVPQQVNITSLFPHAPGANAMADFYQKYVMRLSGASDRVFRGMAYRGAYDEGARVQAMREGLKGNAFDKRVQELLKSPTDEMVAEAIAQSERLTFTNEGALAEALSGAVGIAGRYAQKGIGAGAEVEAALNTLLPFRRTPANIMTRLAEATPGVGLGIGAKRLANWTKLIQQAADEKLAGEVPKETLAAVRNEQRRMIETLMSQGLGIGLFGLGWYLYERGILTGELPDDEAGREQWAAEGRKPNSLLLGGQWLPVGQIAPLGAVLTMAAAMKQNAEREDIPEDVGSLAPYFATATAKGMLNQPMVTGPKEALEAVTGGIKESERFLRSQAGSFVPSALAQATRMTDDVVRRPETIGQAIAARVPGLSRSVPARLNVFGEPMRYGSEIGFAFGDLRRADPTLAEVSRMGVEIGPMARWKNEPIEQYQTRQRDAGKRARQSLQQLFTSSYYLSADEDTKRDLIKSMVEDERRFSTYEMEARGIRRPEKKR